MIIFKKKSTPKIIYRTKPWKIAFMVTTPIVCAAALGTGIYYIVQDVQRKQIKFTFSADSLSSQYETVEVPSLTNDRIKEILIQQFNENQKYKIDTAKPFNVSILPGASSAQEGKVVVSAYFTLTNGDPINSEFEITGFKPQPRPDYLPDSLSVADNADLANIFPQDLVLVDSPMKFNTALPEYTALKQFLFDALPNKPIGLDINEFNIKVADYGSKVNTSASYSPWGGYFNVAYSLNEDIYRYPAYQKTVRLEGFKKYELAPLEPDADGVIMIRASSEYATQTASVVGQNKELVKRIIVQYLRSFAADPESIPLSPSDINIEINKVDNDNGRIYLRSLNITKYNPVLSYSNLCIEGFEILRPRLSSNTIDITAFPEFVTFTAKDISIEQLQTIVLKSLLIPNGLKITSNDIQVIVREKNNSIGSIAADVSIPKFIVKPFNQRVTFRNFSIQRPEPLNGVDMPYLVPSSFANLKPSDLGDSSIKRIIYTYMKSRPSDLSLNDINIISKKPNDAEHSLIVSGNIPKYEQREPYNFTIKIIGFK